MIDFSKQLSVLIKKLTISVKACNVIIFVIYAVLLAIVMVFHEPWFDEAEAWLIARDEPLSDLLLVQTRYE